MYEERLKHYLDDLSPDVNLIDEAIASLEHHFGLIPENELLHFSRSEAIAYLALKQIVRCKDCVNFKMLPIDNHGHQPYWCDNLHIYSEGQNWFCGDGVKEETFK